MVYISIFARFIPETSIFNVLAIKYDILLETGFLIKQTILKGHLSIKIVIDDIEDCSNPKAVAGVD